MAPARRRAALAGVRPPAGESIDLEGARHHDRDPRVVRSVRRVLARTSTIGRTGTRAHIAIHTRHIHLIRFTDPAVRPRPASCQDTISDIALQPQRSAPCPACVSDRATDPAIDAFVTAHTDLRIRGAFRLLGVVLTAALVLPLSVVTLQMFHDGSYLIYPGPFAGCWVLGELVVAARRAIRRRNPRIPVARLVRWS